GACFNAAAPRSNSVDSFSSGHAQRKLMSLCSRCWVLGVRIGAKHRTPLPRLYARKGPRRLAEALSQHVFRGRLAAWSTIIAHLERVGDVESPSPRAFSWLRNCPARCLAAPMFRAAAGVVYKTKVCFQVA